MEAERAEIGRNLIISAADLLYYLTFSSTLRILMFLGSRSSSRKMILPVTLSNSHAPSVAPVPSSLGTAVIALG